MGRKDSARGPFAERCFLVGPFCSAARADAPLRREVSSSSLARMDIGLPALQLRFLATSCLAGACAAALAATSCLARALRLQRCACGAGGAIFALHAGQPGRLGGRLAHSRYAFQYISTSIIVAAVA